MKNTEKYHIHEKISKIFKKHEKVWGRERRLGKTPCCPNPNTTENCTTPPLTLSFTTVLACNKNIFQHTAIYHKIVTLKKF